MRLPSPSRCLQAFTLGLLLLIPACDDPLTGRPVEPEIVNLTDSFSYQVKDLFAVTGSWAYTWENTGTLAKVTHASDAGGSGGATLTITDAGGTRVYSGSLASTGETLTGPAGTPGAWTIRVTMTSYTNTQVNFAVITQ